MKYIKFFVLMACASTLTFTSCVNSNKKELEEQHQQWIESLNDSISLYQSKLDSIQNELTTVNNKIGTLLYDFAHISNPREVAGYYILDGWQNKYPLKQTGIVARINEDEKIEVIAALQKGSFTHVSLEADGKEYTSRPVPHDQAFNYKTDGLNTVCFTGGSADSLAMFIANHDADKIKMTFIENTATGNFTIPENEKNMITQTWTLYSTKREAVNLEKLISLFNGRIAACRKIILSNDTVNNK